MKVLLIIIAIYFLLKYVTRYLGPLLLKYFSNKLFEKLQEQNYTNNNQFHTKSTKANSETFKTSKKTEVVGEYIDFEEIE